ncbi:MAG: N-acetylmuramoyl-L-alanine amidase [Fimbriimonadaceae bacterium]|nr:N-acetylmuramoyl-L-alanine amidase [Fimbriimonadaceae bacterium]
MRAKDIVRARVFIAVIAFAATSTSGSRLPRLFIPVAITSYPAIHLSPRPNNTTVDTIVLHHTANDSVWATTKWFQNPTSRVSAHFTVGKDGSIAQHVSTEMTAWHAGVSQDGKGRRAVNRYSIGIELVNRGDGSDPWTPAQLKATILLIGALLRDFPIRQIVSHEFVARPVGRKNDPINFPWNTLTHFGVPLHFGEPKPN